MNWFPLPIFPEGSLASSVVTTVWVGVLVCCVMNLRFGWTFSGLVVPGYLAPLIIAKPWAAAVIVAEALLTLLTVYAITWLMPRLKLSCAFFGRDRFMAMIMVSSVYRVLADTWLLPMLGEYLTSQHQIDFDYANNLQSFGLIVICLAANQLWKTGIVKGAVPFAFNILVTFLLVRYVLMEFTNFSISNLSFLYEDIATSIYAAPKAYIVLITTSLLASRMNLLYGWDFNGIMIPALIALQWYEPAKVLTSFVEALVILGIAVLTLRLPWFRSASIEGARKLLLFFTISFVYKMAIGWALLFAAPEIKVSDFYGFGYLLPTLMAIKMHQQGKIIHQLRITAQISIVSVLVANVIGFTLSFLPDSTPSAETNITVLESRQTEESQLEMWVKRSFIDTYTSVGAELPTGPRPDEIYRFERGLGSLMRFASSDSATDFDRALGELAGVGFRVDRIGGRYLQVSAPDPTSGRPILVIDRHSTSKLAVECPRALEELDTFDAALALFLDQGARILVIVGAEKPHAGPAIGSYGMARSWFGSLHRTLCRGGAIQVRRAGTAAEQSSLYVKGTLPEALNLRMLEEQFGSFSPLWEAPPESNPIRDTTRREFCELFLSDAALVPAGPEIQIGNLEEPIDSLIRHEIEHFAPTASNLYAAPSAADLLNIDRNILRPLFALELEQARMQLKRIGHHASFYGYGIAAYEQAGGIYVLLKESEPRRYWGSVVIRIGPGSAAAAAPICLEVPSRVDDRTLGSFAATQFKRLGARALIAAGTNYLTNSDGGATLTVMQKEDSLFDLAHQGFVRSVMSGDPLVIQCRAFVPAPGEPYPEEDLIFAAYGENRTAIQNRAALAALIERLDRDGIAVGEAAQSSPYAAGRNLQASYLDFSPAGTFTICWLSPSARENFRSHQEDDPRLKMLKATGITIRDDTLENYLQRKSFLPPSTVSETLKLRLQAFRELGDIHILQHLGEGFAGDQFEALSEPDGGQLLLICLSPEGKVRLIANLSRHAFDRPDQAGSITPSEFIDARAAWLEQNQSPQK